MYEYELGTQVLRIIVIQYPDIQRAQDTYSDFIKSYFFDQPIENANLLAGSEYIQEVEDEKHTGIKVINNFVIIVFEADDEASVKEILNLQASQLKD